MTSAFLCFFALLHFPFAIFPFTNPASLLSPLSMSLRAVLRGSGRSLRRTYIDNVPLLIVKNKHATKTKSSFVKAFSTNSNGNSQRRMFSSMSAPASEQTAEKIKVDTKNYEPGPGLDVPLPGIPTLKCVSTPLHFRSMSIVLVCHALLLLFLACVEDGSNATTLDLSVPIPYISLTVFFRCF